MRGTTELVWSDRNSSESPVSSWSSQDRIQRSEYTNYFLSYHKPVKTHKTMKSGVYETEYALVFGVMSYWKPLLSFVAAMVPLVAIPQGGAQQRTSTDWGPTFHFIDQSHKFHHISKFISSFPSSSILSVFSTNHLFIQLFPIVRFFPPKITNKNTSGFPRTGIFLKGWPWLPGCPQLRSAPLCSAPPCWWPSGCPFLRHLGDWNHARTIW